MARHDDEMGRAGVEIGLPVLDLVGVDADRPFDLRGIAVEARAPLVEHAVLRREVLRRSEAVPTVGVLRDEPQCHLLAAATDQDRNVSHRRGMQSTEALHDHRQRLLEPAQAIGSRAELVPVLVVVALEPTRADAEDEAAVADVVDRAGHVGEQVRVPVRVARDERAETRVARFGGQRREQRVGLEVLGVRVAVEGIEVVPDPDAVDTELVGGAPRRAHRVDRRGLGMDLDTDLEARHAGPFVSRRRVQCGGHPVRG